MSFRDFRRRQERDCARKLAAIQILDDLRRWRANHRTQQAITDLDTCQTLWDLPTRQPDRKETGQ